MTPEQRARKLVSENPPLYPQTEDKFEKEIITAIEQAILEEREECAKVAEDIYHNCNNCGAGHFQYEASNAIRARGEK